MMGGHCQVTGHSSSLSCQSLPLGQPGEDQSSHSSNRSSQAELPEGSENASGQLPPHCPPLLQELREQSPCMLERDTVRWVLTVPAIWKQPAKQFMREAAYLVRMCRWN